MSRSLENEPPLGSDSCVREYRVRRLFRPLGPVFMLMALVLAPIGTVVAWQNADGSFSFPRATAVSIGLFGLCAALAGDWVTRDWYRSRLYVSEEHVQKVGCFHTRTMQLDDVLCAKWRGTRPLVEERSYGFRSITVTVESGDRDERRLGPGRKRQVL